MMKGGKGANAAACDDTSSVEFLFLSLGIWVLFLSH